MGHSGSARFAYLVVAPIFFLLILFVWYPAANTLLTSLYFLNFKVSPQARFVGLANYATILMNRDFLAALRNTVFFLLILLLVSLPSALGGSLVLNEKFRGRTAIRAVAIAPWTLPPIVAGFLWRWILNGSYGVLNGLLWQLGVIHEYQVWLIQPVTAMILCGIVQAWRDIPFVMMIFLASLQSIPPDLYESATVCGAGAMQRFRYVTLPLLRPAIAVGLALETIYGLLGFDIIYALTGFDPSTKILNLLNYEVAFRLLDFGLASALSYILLLGGAAVGYFYIRRIYRGYAF